MRKDSEAENVEYSGRAQKGTGYVIAEVPGVVRVMQYKFSAAPILEATWGAGWPNHNLLADIIIRGIRSLEEEGGRP